MAMTVRQGAIMTYLLMATQIPVKLPIQYSKYLKTKIISRLSSGGHSHNSGEHNSACFNKYLFL